MAVHTHNERFRPNHPCVIEVILNAEVQLVAQFQEVSLYLGQSLTAFSTLKSLHLCVTFTATVKERNMKL